MGRSSSKAGGTSGRKGAAGPPENVVQIDKARAEKVSATTRAKPRGTRGRKSADGIKTGRRPKFDVGAAFAYYYALGPGTRSIAAVAESFGLAESTVRRHAAKRVDGMTWEQRAKHYDTVAWKHALESDVVPRRSAIVELALKNAHLVALKFRTMTLADPDYRPEAGDVVALVKLAELLQGEPTERFEHEMYGEVMNLGDEELAGELGRLRGVDEALAAGAQLPPLGLPAGEIEDAEFEEVAAGDGGDGGDGPGPQDHGPGPQDHGPGPKEPAKAKVRERRPADGIDVAAEPERGRRRGPQVIGDEGVVGEDTFRADGPAPDLEARGLPPDPWQADRQERPDDHGGGPAGGPDFRRGR